MNLASPHDKLRLPATLESQLHAYRRRVWTIKFTEAVCIAICGVFVAFLLVFLLDRLVNTPLSIRFVIFSTALCCCAIVPWCFHRWIWRQRRLDQLARLLGRKMPQVGDQLLGIIELVDSESEQARSRTLCEAAVEQVASGARNRNLASAVPEARHRFWGLLASTLIAIGIGLVFFFPRAAGNSWARLLAPWLNTPRYTFAAFYPLPERMIVPHGEPFPVIFQLAEDSPWRPPHGEVRMGGQSWVQAPLENGRYTFELPPRIDDGWLDVRIGDARQRIRIVPMLRPELISVVASIQLPDYLGQTKPLRKDVRGGSILLVRGSRASCTATASRALGKARVDGRPRNPADATIKSPVTLVDRERKIEFEWEDTYGLSGKEPFTLVISGCDDEAPTLTCEGIPRRHVVFDSEQLVFRVRAHDDFGIRHIGMEWTGDENNSNTKPAQGERILAAGGSDKVALDITGTFKATSLGISPQPILLRIFTEDYLADRGRIYSPTYLLFVLSPDQHAIWMTEQLSTWHRQSLEVRDREMQLHETNRELRGLPSEVLDQAATRRRIENQAAAELANSRRLSQLVTTGEALILQASRNPEFGVGHLEKWAAMLQILKDISANRMPSVADLLAKASQAENAPANASTSPAAMAGQNRASDPGSPGENPHDEKKESSPIIGIADVESTQQPSDQIPSEQASNNSRSNPSLTLPTTTLLGGGPPDNTCPASQKMEEAVQEQRDLLAEFEKIATELNTILANLEGSTLVKRLKAAAREQYEVAGRIGEQFADSFGLGQPAGTATQKVFNELSETESKASFKVSLIMDDMQAYFDRRRFVKFKTVLDDMGEQDVVGNLRVLAEDLPMEHGLSMAQCEYWSDSLDRWAEDLVDPASGGT